MATDSLDTRVAARLTLGSRYVCVLVNAVFQQEKKSLQEQVERLQQDNTSYKNESEKIIQALTYQLDKQERQIQNITDICQEQKQEMGNERSKYTNELHQKNETIKQQHQKIK